MPTVAIAPHLCHQFNVPTYCRAQGVTLGEVVADLDRQFPGIARYLLDDQGTLRKHVNLFVNDSLIQDRETLSDPVAPDDRIHVFQALSGG